MTTTASALLAAHTVTGLAEVALVTCPGNTAIIVKEITWNAAVGTSGTFALYLWKPASNVVLYFVQEDPPVIGFHRLTTWWLLDPGAIVATHVTAGAVTFWISGSVLTPAAPWVPAASSLELLSPLPA